MIHSNSLLIKPPKPLHSTQTQTLKTQVRIPTPTKYPTYHFSKFQPTPTEKGSSFERMGVSNSIGCFGNGKIKEKQVEVSEKLDRENVGGGVDVMDANASPHHLVVMVNGLIGSASDWKFAADQFVRQKPDKIIVHCSLCNPGKLTFDGVDKMGERLADEVLTVIKHRPGLRKISFVAHSLGGLVARYAVGKLYEPIRDLDPSVPNEEFAASNNSSCDVERGAGFIGRIAGLEPMNFITVATPHLGSRGHGQLPFLCGVTFLERQAQQTAHLVAGRSGKHLFLVDDDEGTPPLLVRMVSDSYEFKFMSVGLLVVSSD